MFTAEFFQPKAEKKGANLNNRNQTSNFPSILS